MNHYFYLLRSSDGATILPGICKDLDKMVKWQNGHNAIMLKPEKALKLVYLELADKADLAQKRYQDVFRYTKEQKEELARTINPDLIEMIEGVNFEF